MCKYAISSEPITDGNGEGELEIRRSLIPCLTSPYPDLKRGNHIVGIGLELGTCWKSCTWKPSIPRSIPVGLVGQNAGGACLGVDSCL